MEFRNNSELVWKAKDQEIYYKKFVLGYVLKILKYCRDTNTLLRIHSNGEDESLEDIFNNFRTLFSMDRINIQDFYTKEKLPSYPQDFMQIIFGSGIEDMGFSIETFGGGNPENRDMIDCGNPDKYIAECPVCGDKNGVQIWFEGLVHNIGDKPIKYNGYIDTQKFLKCRCESEINDDIIYTKDTIHHLELNTEFTIVFAEPIFIIGTNILYNLRWCNNPYTVNLAKEVAKLAENEEYIAKVFNPNRMRSYMPIQDLEEMRQDFGWTIEEFNKHIK